MAVRFGDFAVLESKFLLVAADRALHLFNGRQKAVVTAVEAFNGRTIVSRAAEALFFNQFESRVEAFPNLGAMVARELHIAEFALQLFKLVKKRLEPHAFCNSFFDILQGLHKLIIAIFGVLLELIIQPGAQALQVGK